MATRVSGFEPHRVAVGAIRSAGSETLPNIPNAFVGNLLEEWKNNSKDYLDKLINRMPTLVEAVLRTKDGFFDEKKV